MALSPSSPESTRRLRGAAYALGVIMLVVQLAELVLGVFPAQVHAPAWRLSFAGGTANIMMMSLLATFILITTSAVYGDQKVSLVLGILSAVAVVFYLAMSGVFALDALQMRGQVRMAVARQYDFGSAWVLSRMLMAVIGFVILAVTSLRVAKAGRKDVARPRATGGLVVGGQRPLPRADETAGVKRS